MGKRMTVRYTDGDKVSIVAKTGTITGCTIYASKSVGNNPLTERYDVAIPVLGDDDKMIVAFDVSWEILKPEKI